MNKTAIILAGGIGKRLRPLTKTIPKPLLPLGNSTIITIIIDYLVKNDFNKIILATRYKSDKFKSEIPKLKKKYKNCNFIISEEKKKLGTCGPILLVKNELPKKFLVINGDIITNLNIKFHFNKFLKTKKKILIFSKEIITPFEFGKINIRRNKILNIEEKPITKNKIISGIYFLDKDCTRYIPNNKYFGMDDLIKLFLKKKVQLYTYLMKKEFWLDVGRQSDYEKIKKKILI
jgi:NDP-sugar pyrophosphorylase family protein